MFATPEMLDLKFSLNVWILLLPQVVVDPSLVTLGAPPSWDTPLPVLGRPPPPSYFKDFSLLNVTNELITHSPYRSLT